MIKVKAIQKDRTPHTFVILFFLVFLACFLTHVIPAGEFERIKDAASGQTVVVDGSYTGMENSPVAVWSIPAKLFEALTSGSTSKLIFFIFFIGGSFEIIQQTGSITAFFENLLGAFQKKRFWIIPIFVALFSIPGFTMGLSTTSVIFVPIGILAARMLGFGKLTGTAMVALGVNAGFAAGIYNPFSVGVAQTIAEVPLFSGAWIRWLLLVCLLAATSFYIMHYATKFDRESGDNGKCSGKDCTAEITNEITVGGNEWSAELLKDGKVQKILTFRQKLVLIIFLMAFGIVTYGISAWDWKVQDISMLFLMTGIVCGIVYGFKVNEICDMFVNGCKRMVKGVFVIGLAAAMRLILYDGHIMDTITFYLTGFAKGFPAWAKLMGMFYGNAALDFLITSGSAHAAVAMPIMIPMADYLGLTRQSVVFAFQLGDGLVNLCSPISTTLTGVLAVSGISYGKWVKFFFPLVGIYIAIGTVFIFLAGMVGY